MDDEIRKARAFPNIDKVGSDIHEKLLQTLVEEAPLGPLLSALKRERPKDGFYANPDFCDYRAYGKECNALPKAWEFIHPEDRKSIDETFKEPPFGAKAHREVRGLKSDGTVVHLDIVATRNTFEECRPLSGPL